MSNIIDIKLAGRWYKLSTDEDAEYVQRLADYATAKIYEFKRGNHASPLDCATMATLILADELFKAEQKLAESEITTDGKNF